MKNCGFFHSGVGSGVQHIAAIFYQRNVVAGCEKVSSIPAIHNRQWFIYFMLGQWSWLDTYQEIPRVECTVEAVLTCTLHSLMAVARNVVTLLSG